MKSSEIELSSIAKTFEYEKLSRDIDKIDDMDYLKEMCKCYLKLYFKQQETIGGIGLIDTALRKKKGFYVNDEVIFIGGSEEQRRWGGCNPAYDLEENVTYTITKVEVKSQHTRLTLKGIDGFFNSVLFKVRDED